jgi:hypothetical protein
MNYASLLAHPVFPVAAAAGRRCPKDKKAKKLATQNTDASP